MEDPLLPSGSSSSTSANRGRESGGALKNVLGRRGEAITTGNVYQKAAAMVDQVPNCCIPPLESSDTL